jgi:hypothetical protein
MPASELTARDGVSSRTKSKKSVKFADVFKSGKPRKTFAAVEMKAIKLETPDQYTLIGEAPWGLSLAMDEKATMKDGAIEQTNFHDNTPLRMSQTPEVAISIIANGEPATAVGEPAVTVVAPALGNAIFNAVGARVRSLPITSDAVRAAMKA